ncbi:MAG: hypothetical protein B1H13_05705 [Desulfobacteraceae bacterium 4484_190.3]|nr:MAG: hypothetical protein B1H13_05705 [Desulfobacteraceae bacterium 4484_190.3]
MRSSARIILAGTAGAVFLDGCAPGISMPCIFGQGGTGILLFTDDSPDVNRTFFEYKTNEKISYINNIK